MNNDTLYPDHLRTFDFTRSNADIENLKALPPEARAVWDKAEVVISHGFQELIGYVGRQAIFACGGYWDEGPFRGQRLFHITSMGDGTQLYKEQS